MLIYLISLLVLSIVTWSTSVLFQAIATRFNLLSRLPLITLVARLLLLALQLWAYAYLELWLLYQGFNPLWALIYPLSILILARESYLWAGKLFRYHGFDPFLIN